MKNILFLFLLLPYFSFISDKIEGKKNSEDKKEKAKDLFVDNIGNALVDGCSGAATFTLFYNPVNNCYIFTNTTNNDCGSNGICTWDFGDGSPTVTTIQGANTICHSFPDCDTYTISLTYDATSCYPTAIC